MKLESNGERRKNVCYLPEGVPAVHPPTGFDGCTSLSSILLPEGFTAVGGKAFLGCTSLFSVTTARPAANHTSTCLEGSLGVAASSPCRRPATSTRLISTMVRARRCRVIPPAAVLPRPGSVVVSLSFWYVQQDEGGRRRFSAVVLGWTTTLGSRTPLLYSSNSFSFGPATKMLILSIEFRQCLRSCWNWLSQREIDDEVPEKWQGCNEQLRRLPVRANLQSPESFAEQGL